MTGESVSGVLGLGRVGLANLTQLYAAPFLGWRHGVSGVSG